MQPAELIDNLQRTGTGEKKLQILRKWADENKGKSAEELFEYAKTQDSIPEGTRHKMRRFIDGARPEEFIGPRPEGSQEAQEVRLATALANVLQGRRDEAAQAEKQQTERLAAERDEKTARQLAEQGPRAAEQLHEKQDAKQQEAQAQGVGRPQPSHRSSRG